MNQLDITADPEANEEGLDFVLEGSQVNLLENKVVLAVPEGNPAGIESFADLGTDKLGLLALGNEDVPVGQYSTEILTNLGFLEGLEADGKITYGSNVKEVTTQVSEASRTRASSMRQTRSRRGLRSWTRRGRICVSR